MNASERVCCTNVTDRREGGRVCEREGRRQRGFMGKHGEEGRRGLGRDMAGHRRGKKSEWWTVMGWDGSIPYPSMSMSMIPWSPRRSSLEQHVAGRQQGKLRLVNKGRAKMSGMTRRWRGQQQDELLHLDQEGWTGSGQPCPEASVWIVTRRQCWDGCLMHCMQVRRGRDARVWSIEYGYWRRGQGCGGLVVVKVGLHEIPLGEAPRNLGG